MIKSKNTISFIIILTIVLFACSTSSNIHKLTLAIKESTVEDSAISFTDTTIEHTDKRWFTFYKQDKSIQDHYLAYLNEIADCISSLNFKKVKDEEFKGNEIFSLKLNIDDKDYIFIVKYIYPEVSCLKISIDSKTEYYFLNEEASKRLSDVIFSSDNFPFNHISLIDYLINESK